MVKCIANDDKDQKILAFQSLAESVQRLTLLIDREETPTWMTKLAQLLYNVNTNYHPTNLEALSVYTSTAYQQMIRQSWDYLDDDLGGFLVQDVVQSNFEHSGVNKLFDTLVEQLKGVIDSGEIETVRALKSLNGLVALIRKNQKQASTAWVLIKNVHVVAWNYLMQLSTDEKVNPYIRHALPAIEKTLADLETEVDKVYDDSSVEVNARLVKEIPLLENKFVSLNSIISKDDVPRLESL